MFATAKASSGWAARLRRFVSPPRMEHCELCRAEIPTEHAHLIDVLGRRLVCACRACSMLLGERPDSRYRCVSGRSEVLRGFRLTDSEWNAFNIPIDMAFLFHSTPEARPVALYPGPAGAMEQPLIASTWSTLVANNPALADLSPDVEALLVNRLNGRRTYYRVSIDHCFALVGLIRANWRGLSGGAEVWALIDAFFVELQTVGAEPVDPRHD